MPSTPTVTVIALCYNHARFVLETLESIRAQTFQDFELIVTDDASRDNSPELIAQWLAEHRPDASFIRHASNAGLCRTLNEALADARGAYVCMIATDDTWYPDRLARHMEAMAAAPANVAVVYSDADQMDEEGNALPTKFIEYYRKDFAPPSGALFPILADGNFIPAMAATIRRSAIDAVGGYDERLSYEDYDMWLRLAPQYDFLFCPGRVARYRIVSTSMVRVLSATPSPLHLYTIFLMNQRWLRTTLLSPAQRTQWSEALWSAAYKLFLADDWRAPEALRAAARYKPTARIFLLAMTSSLGLTRSRIKRLLGARERLAK